MSLTEAVTVNGKVLSGSAAVVVGGIVGLVKVVATGVESTAIKNPEGYLNKVITTTHGELYEEFEDKMYTIGENLKESITFDFGGKASKPTESKTADDKTTVNNGGN